MNILSWFDVKNNNIKALQSIVNTLCPPDKNGFINFWFISLDGDLRLCHKNDKNEIEHQHSITLMEAINCLPTIKDSVIDAIEKLNEKLCSLE